MNSHYLAGIINGLLDQSVQEIRNGIITSEHDWSTWLGWAASHVPALQSEGIKVLVEYRANYRKECTPPRGRNAHIDIAFLIEEPCHGRGNDVVALIELKMKRGGKSDKQIHRSVEDDWRKLTKTIASDDIAHPSGLILVCAGWTGGRHGELLSRFSETSPSVRVDWSPGKRLVWDRERFLDLMHPRQRMAPTWTTAFHRRLSNGFGGYRRINIAELSCMDALARRLLNTFEGIRVHREYAIPKVPGNEQSGGRADIIISDATAPHRLLGLIEGKGLLVIAKTADYPCLSRDNSLNGRAMETLRQLGDSDFGRAQLNWPHFPRDRQGRHLVLGHLAEDILEMRKEKGRINALITEGNTAARVVAPTFTAIQHYCTGPGWEYQSNLDQEQPLYLRFAQDYLTFLETTLYGDSSPVGLHRFFEAQMYRHDQRHTAEIGRKVRDLACHVWCINGQMEVAFNG